MDRILTELQRVLGVPIDLSFIHHLSNVGVQANIAAKNNYFISWFARLPQTVFHRDTETQYRLIDSVTGATIDTLIKIKHEGESGIMYRSPEHFYKPFTIVPEAFNPSSILFDDDVFMDEFKLRNLLTEIFIQTVLWCDPEVSRYFSRPHHLYKLSETSYLIDMEVIQGYTLEETLNDRSPITLRVLKPFISEIAKLLTYLQEKKQFQHGDLHNQNILVDTRGQLKIIDFGKSSVILGDMIFGYSAPKGDLWDPEYFSQCKDISDLLQSIITYQAAKCDPQTLRFLKTVSTCIPEEILTKLNMIGGRRKSRRSRII